MNNDEKALMDSYEKAYDLSRDAALVAEFDGWKLSSSSGGGDYWTHANHVGKWKLLEMEYHKDWRWQIPVYGKVARRYKDFALSQNRRSEGYQSYFTFLEKYEAAVFNNDVYAGFEVVLSAVVFVNGLGLPQCCTQAQEEFTILTSGKVTAGETISATIGGATTACTTLMTCKHCKGSGCKECNGTGSPDTHFCSPLRNEKADALTNDQYLVRETIITLASILYHAGAKDTCSRKEFFDAGNLVLQGTFSPEQLKYAKEKGFLVLKPASDQLEF